MVQVLLQMCTMVFPVLESWAVRCQKFDLTDSSHFFLAAGFYPTWSIITPLQKSQKENNGFTIASKLYEGPKFYPSAKKNQLHQKIMV